jgi:hypothetical protein
MNIVIFQLFKVVVSSYCLHYIMIYFVNSYPHNNVREPLFSHSYDIIKFILQIARII